MKLEPSARERPFTADLTKITLRIYWEVML